MFSYKKIGASLLDEWEALPHDTDEDFDRRNKTCLPDMLKLSNIEI